MQPQPAVTNLRPPAAQPAPPAAQAPVRWPFAFYGTTRHYFWIYTTNVLLSLVTLGVYTAWAKVRNRRFFYGLSELHGHRFDFDARPLTILISRILVVGVIIGATQVDLAFELLWNELGLLSSLLLLLVPFALVRGRAFNARHSLFMGVRFHYRRIYWPAYKVFLCFTVPLLSLPVLLLLVQQGTEDGADMPVVPTLLLLAVLVYLAVLWPRWDLMNQRVRINQLQFGRLSMKYTATLRQYYVAYVRALAAPLVLYVAAALLAVLAAPMPLVTIFVALLVISLAWPLAYHAMRTKIFWNSLSFADGSALRAGFTSSGYFFKIMVGNSLIILLTLGALLPWARVRKWRYIARHLVFIPSAGRLDVFDRPDAFKEAMGAEYMDMETFGLDYGLL